MCDCRHREEATEVMQKLGRLLLCVCARERMPLVILSGFVCMRDLPDKGSCVQGIEAAG